MAPPTPAPPPMKPRDVMFLVAAVALLGAVGFMVLAGPDASAAGPEFGAASHDVTSEPVRDDEEPAPTQAPAAAAMTAGERSWAPTTGPDSGVIRGHITLDSKVVKNLKLVYIKIREAINSDLTSVVPFVRTIKEEIIPELGTPEFVYGDIPFSEYGYVVRVYAEGLNGSEMFVQVNEAEPVADVMLSVTAAVPFSVLLRDQLKFPVTETAVFLRPIGDPPLRPLQQMKTDSYGSAVFDRVLQGDYEIIVGAMNQPRNEPTRVSVLAHAGVRSVTVEVPRGFPLTVFAQTRRGWGVEGAKLRLWITSTQFREYTGETDFAGKFVFDHLPAGTYQLDVSGDRFQRSSRHVEISAEAPPEPVIVQLSYR